jgi:aminoglycoside phosphotransferase (APT) family kinase protein
VRRLVAAQFPQWTDLPVAPVELDGWDNTTFRLGDELSIRLPSADAYVPQVEKEHRWLPLLAPQLPLPIPDPVAKGGPSEVFPRPWSVYRWLDGDHATVERVTDLERFAADLADFLAALYRIDPAGGPAAGRHNFFRGGPLATYDNDTREAISALVNEIDTDAAATLWEDALAAAWQGRPVWVHGDVAASNLLVVDGRLAAVLDFGSAGVGDPACDLVISWTLFTDESRAAFRNRLRPDDATWTRGRGWALWKALLTLVKAIEANDGEQDLASRRFGWRIGARAVIDEVLADR